MPTPLLLPIFTFKKHKIMCILIVLNISSAYAADNAEDYVDEADISDYTPPAGVDEASGVTAKGLYKALTPLQRRANAVAPMDIPSTLHSTEPMYKTGRRPEQLQADMQASLDAQKAQTKLESTKHSAFREATEAAAGGITRDIFEAATQETASEHVDPKYDSGKNREEFISKYPLEYLQAYDNTVNQWQQDALIQKIKDIQKRKAVMSASPAGAIVGYLFIPMLLTIALFLLFNFKRKNKPESSALPSDKAQPKPKSVTGLVQKIKDGFFATKCTEQIKHVMPNAGAEAEQFCTHNLLYLTAFLDKGMSFDAAVNYTCMSMLDNAETMLAPDKTHGLESLMLASKYAAMFVDRWPSAEQSPAFLQALEKYIYYINNNPIVKDVERMGFNFNQLKS